MQIWVVYEANSIVPHLFTDRTVALKYRTERASRVRHAVYIQPAELDETQDDEDDN